MPKIVTIEIAEVVKTFGKFIKPPLQVIGPALGKLFLVERKLEPA
jgi:hypothetical protein